MTVLTGTNAAAAASTTASITLPTFTPGTNDLILVFVSAPASPTYTTPSGYGIAVAKVGTAPSSILYSKKAVSGDSGATVNITLSVSSLWSVTYRIYSNAYVATAVSKNGAAATSATFTAVIPAWGSANGEIGCEFICGLPASGQTDTLTVPTGYGNTAAVHSTGASSINTSQGSWDIATGLTSGSSWTPSAVTQSVSVKYNALSVVVGNYSNLHPAFGSFSATTTDRATSTAPGVPPGVTLGMPILLLTETWWDGATSAPTSSSVTPPTGFSIATDGSSNPAFYGTATARAAGGYTGLGVWVKFADSTDVSNSAAGTGSYTITYTSLGGDTATAWAVACALVGSTVTSGSPLVDTNQTDFASGTNATIATFTPGANGTVLLGLVFPDSGNLTTTFPTGWVADAEAGGWVSPTVSHFTQATAAATGSLVWNDTGTNDIQALIVSIRNGSAQSASGAGTVSFAGSAGGTVTVAATAAGTASFAGSATTSYAQTATAAGAISFAGAATTALSTPATAAGSVSFAGTGTGTVKVPASAAGTVSFAGAAATTYAQSATASGTVAFSGTASGVVTVGATAAGAASFAGTATTSYTQKTTASGTVTFAGTATATPSVAATATGAVSFVGAATGTVSVPTTAAGAVSFVGAAQPEPAGGASAAGTVSFAGTSSATVTVPTTAAGTTSFAGSTTGTVSIPATASGTVSFAGAAQPEPAGGASGAGTVSFAGTATPAYSQKTTAAGTVMFVGAATASIKLPAAAAGTVSFAGAGSGLPVLVANAAGTISFAGTATAHPVIVATASGGVTFAGAGTTSYAQPAVATGTVLFDGTASPRPFLALGAAGQVVFAGTAAAHNILGVAPDVVVVAQAHLTTVAAQAHSTLVTAQAHVTDTAAQAHLMVVAAQTHSTIVEANPA